MDFLSSLVQEAITILYNISASFGFANYGFAIILLTVIVKLATYPLTKKQIQSMKAMQRLQPKMKAIQEKYKGDKMKANEALAQLAGRGIKMAVVTSKKRPMALRGLACYGLDKYIETVVTCQDCEEHKPLPAPSLMALKNLKLNGSDCIGVGDSPYDLQSAKGAGCLTAAVRYTSFDWDFILNEGKPDYVLNKMDDLVKLIDRLNN